MGIGNFVKSADFKNEKHVPVIECPNGLKKGEFCDVVVSVGKEIPHPNTTEHFINWIALYFKPAEGNIYNLGRAEFLAHGESTKGPNQGPAYTNPVACFKVKLDEPGKLIAESYCNIHGLWESEVDINF